MSDCCKDITNSGRQVAKKETQQQASTWENEEREEVQGQSEDLPVLEKAEESDIGAKETLKAPPSFEAVTQVVLTKAPVFGLTPAAPDETGEPSWAQPADTQQLFQQISQPQPVKPPSPPPKPQPVYSNEDVMAVLDCVVEEVVEAEMRDVAQSCASYATAALAESSVQVESVLSEVLRQILQEVSAEIKLESECVAEEKRKLEEARSQSSGDAPAAGLLQVHATGGEAPDCTGGVRPPV